MLSTKDQCVHDLYHNFPFAACEMRPTVEPSPAAGCIMLHAQMSSKDSGEDEDEDEKAVHHPMWLKRL